MDLCGFTPAVDRRRCAGGRPDEAVAEGHPARPHVVGLPEQLQPAAAVAEVLDPRQEDAQ